MLPVIIFFVIHWYFSLFCQSFFLHRYVAHGMFTMNKFWEKFFSLLTYIGQGSSYLSPRAYGILHKMHHAFSDTEKDPHSPHHTHSIFAMMWETKNLYSALVRNCLEIEARFEVPYIWKSLENWAESWFSRIAWGTLYTLFYIACYLYFDLPWVFFLVLPIHYFMGPVHGAIVNWAGHKYGYSNFDNNDKSKNSLFFDFLTLGELFQNNHHKLPNRVNFAVKWFEIDPIYYIIKVMNWLGIIRLKPQAVRVMS
ncbi:MAG: acyl-CoA desaturase [Microscillaceae bacterium]|nr:acyl-CoA desaturase [Microscillaceae bacterium]MDW8460098.1 acyl-CoA desaturase [Cytophagales bacterium]